jgi:hypothetical protein
VIWVVGGGEGFGRGTGVSDEASISTSSVIISFWQSSFSCARLGSSSVFAVVMSHTVALVVVLSSQVSSRGRPAMIGGSCWCLEVGAEVVDFALPDALLLFSPENNPVEGVLAPPFLTDVDWVFFSLSFLLSSYFFTAF